MALSESGYSEDVYSAYIFVSTTSVFTWDILCHVRDDYRIVAHHRVTFPTIVYFASKLFTLLYLIGHTIISTTPLGHCNLAVRVATSPLVISLPASELLLLLHVRAIYATERIITWFISTLWLITVASVIYASVVTSGTSVGSTELCAPVISTEAVLSMIGVHMLNDTLLFVALVWRVLRTSSKDLNEYQLKDLIKDVLFGKYLPHFAKVLLKNGQQYFLASVMIHIISLSLFFSQTSHNSLDFPSVMLMSLMATRLYRKTKLMPVQDHSVSFRLSIP